MGRPKGSKNVISTRVNLQCLECKTIFSVPPCLKDVAKFCCHKCYGKSMEGKPNLSKGNTGKPSPKKGTKLSEETKKKISMANKGKKPSEETKIKMRSHRGECHPNWRGGKYLAKAGYIFVHSTGHPFVSKNGYVMEHRLVMEKHIGRYLQPAEVVHHINGIKDDNRIENLQLFSNKSSHTKLHYEEYKNNNIESGFIKQQTNQRRGKRKSST